MKNNTKLLLGLGVGAAALWALSKRAKDESDVELALVNTRTGESVGLEGDGIAGTISNPVEGESYQLIATVTNQSTRGAGGPGVDVYFFVNLWGNYSDGDPALYLWESGGVLVVSNTPWRFTSDSFTIPVGKAGKTISFYATVAASEQKMGSATIVASVGPKTTAVILSNIVYKATVTLNV